MMRNSKLRAALPNVVKTIAQLRKDYVRTTNTATKNKIVASLQDLRSVKATIDEELALEDEELASVTCCPTTTFWLTACRMIWTWVTLTLKSTALTTCQWQTTTCWATNLTTNSTTRKLNLH